MRFGNFDVFIQSDGKPEMLGEGAFGKTYRARHIWTDRIVALKVIRETLLNNKSEGNAKNEKRIQDRFLNEARHASRLEHRHIAKVLDVGQSEGTFYYAMEYCAGGDLHSYVKASKQPLAPLRALRCVREMADALNYAHQNKLLHRDVKPSNIMLADVSGESIFKLIDFGLVKQYAEEDSSDSPYTLTGETPCTPLFASPEQLGGESMDFRTDVFSLGMTLWLLLEGTLPMAKLSSTKMIAERLSEKSYTPHIAALRYPEKLRFLLAKMVEKAVDDRFKSDLEVIGALDEVIRGFPLEVESPVQGSSQAPTEPLIAAQPVEAPPQKKDQPEPSEPAKEQVQPPNDLLGIGAEYQYSVPILPGVQAQQPEPDVDEHPFDFVLAQSVDLERLPEVEPRGAVVTPAEVRPPVHHGKAEPDHAKKEPSMLAVTTMWLNNAVSRALRTPWIRNRRTHIAIGAVVLLAVVLSVVVGKPDPIVDPIVIVPPPIPPPIPVPVPVPVPTQPRWLVFAGGISPENATISVNDDQVKLGTRGGKPAIELKSESDKPIAVKIAPPKGFGGAPVVIEVPAEGKDWDKAITFLRSKGSVKFDVPKEGSDYSTATLVFAKPLDGEQETAATSADETKKLTVNLDAGPAKIEVPTGIYRITLSSGNTHVRSREISAAQPVKADEVVLLHLPPTFTGHYRCEFNLEMKRKDDVVRGTVVRDLFIARDFSGGTAIDAAALTSPKTRHVLPETFWVTDLHLTEDGSLSGIIRSQTAGVSWTSDDHFLIRPNASGSMEYAFMSKDASGRAVGTSPKGVLERLPSTDVAATLAAVTRSQEALMAKDPVVAVAVAETPPPPPPLPTVPQDTLKKFLDSFLASMASPDPSFYASHFAEPSRYVDEVEKKVKTMKRKDQAREREYLLKRFKVQYFKLTRPYGIKLEPDGKTGKVTFGTEYYYPPTTPDGETWGSTNENLDVALKANAWEITNYEQKTYSRKTPNGPMPRPAWGVEAANATPRP